MQVLAVGAQEVESGLRGLLTKGPGTSDGTGMHALLSLFHVHAIELRITTVSVCHICSAHPCLRASLYTSGLVSVLPSQKIKLYIDDPTHIEI